MPESKSGALPLGYSPIFSFIIQMGWKMGLEPTVSSATNWRVNQLRYIHHCLRALLTSSTFIIITNFSPICQLFYEIFFKLFYEIFFKLYKLAVTVQTRYIHICARRVLYIFKRTFPWGPLRAVKCISIVTAPVGRSEYKNI